MSKYTTEVRYICEQKAGLEASVGANQVDTIVAKSWDKIFTNKFPIYDENYRSVLCQKILKHFYMREIGAETVGLWIMWLNERMEMIMPYYNQLYKSELLKFNPLYDYESTTTSKRTTDKTEDNTQKSNGKTTDKTNGKGNSTAWQYYNDTPQGGIDGIESLQYLTSATKNTNEFTTENTGSGTNENTVKDDRKMNNIDDYVESVKGKKGGNSYSSMLLEFRKTFLNIDSMIIDELNDLFLNLW